MTFRSFSLKSINTCKRVGSETCLSNSATRRISAVGRAGAAAAAFDDRDVLDDFVDVGGIVVPQAVNPVGVSVNLIARVRTSIFAVKDRYSS